MIVTQEQPKRRRKVTKEIADHRRREVRRALGRAEHCYDIVTRFAAEWQISRRQVEEYITQVRASASAELSSRGETERQAQARELEDFLLETMAEAKKKNDRRTAVAAARELGRIRGAYQPERVELTGAGGAPLMPAPQKPVFDLTGYSDEKAKQITDLLRGLVQAPQLAAPSAPGSTENAAGSVPGATGRKPGDDPDA